MNIDLINTIECWEKDLFSTKPISEEYAHLFNMSDLTNHDIDNLIEYNIKDKDLDDLEEELYNLCGGILIRRNTEILISPSCCGDLSDIYNWEDVTLNKSEEWIKLWIGHPWVYSRKLNNEIQLSDYFESDSLDIRPEQIKLSIPLPQFETELEKARRTQEKFQGRLADRLKLKGIKNFRQVAERMGCSYR